MLNRSRRNEGKFNKKWKKKFFCSLFGGPKKIFFLFELWNFCLGKGTCCVVWSRGMGEKIGCMKALDYGTTVWNAIFWVWTVEIKLYYKYWKLKCSIFQKSNLDLHRTFHLPTFNSSKIHRQTLNDNSLQ